MQLLSASDLLPPAKHSALLYETVDEFLATIGPFVATGMAQGDAVIAVAAPANLIALREVLGTIPPWVRLVDGEQWYARGPDTMGLVDGQVAAGRLRVRIVGEVVWPRDPERTAAAAELALNAAVHAGGSVRGATWQEDGSFFCQVEDDGAGIGDPGGGYQPPFDGDQRWGLWQVRQAVELIEFGRSSRGSVVRLRVRRGADPDARAHPALTRL
jgi:hypothetical protein